MTNNYWKVDYCVSPFSENSDPFSEEAWEKFKVIRSYFTDMMKDAGFPDKTPSCTTQYGFCYVLEYIFDLYKDECIGMEDDNHTIKTLSPGGEAYEKLKGKCREKGFRLNIRLSYYMP